MKKVQIQNPTNRWLVVIVIILLLGIISLFTALVIGIFISAADVEASGNIAHIELTGVIVSHAPGSFMDSGFTDATEIIKLIEKADKNPDIKGILLEVNSPGGSGVASWEIVEALDRVNKTKVAWIREGGASGAYWAASATDHIVASPISLTGSIGVIASYIDFAGTLERYNASYQRLVSGKYKDMGTSLRHLTDKEEKMFQEKLDKMRDFFIDSVAQHRDMEREDVAGLAEGQLFLGTEAKELGLIDSLGGKEDAVRYIEDKEDIEAELARYKRPKTLGQLLAGVFSDSSYDVGRGMGKALLDHEVESGVSIRT